MTVQQHDRLCGYGLWWAALVAVAMVGPTARAGDDPAPANRAVADFTLRDFRGHEHRLADLAEKKVVVVAFLGCECPVARLVTPRLSALAKEFGPQGVAVLALDSNSQDSLSEIAEFVREHAIEFPVLKDVGNAVADNFEAERTPEVFVLDADRKIRYRGRIDDQYLVGQTRPHPTREDLKQAIDDVLAGREVSVARTEASGCHIGRIPKPSGQGSITYVEHVAPLLAAKCVSCHRPGEIAPFPLTSYQEVAGWGETIAEVIEARRMPPWLADPQFGHFANNPTLSDDERRLIADWLAGGAPEGDAARAPASPTFTDGWQISTPDQVLYIADEPVDVPAEGVVRYQHFLIDPGFKTDRWIQAAEARPGNRGVVHHIVAHFIPPGAKPRVGLNGASVGFAPGMPPVRMPKGAAMFVPAGSKVLFQLHYTPNGAPQKDRSSLGIVFADPETVHERVESGGAANLSFELAPGAADVEVKSQHRFPVDTRMVSLMPHMHLRGKSFRYEVQYPDGKSEVLLDVPRYDFNWQLRYEFAEPKLLPAGTLLTCTAHYDNSERNPVNPDAAVRVRWGEQTWDEMMIGYFGAISAVGATPVDKPASPPALAVRDDDQSRQKAEQIVRAGIEALGGEKRLAERRVLSFEIRGTVYVVAGIATPMSGHMALDPLGRRSRLAVEGPGFNLVLVLEGEHAWLKLNDRERDLPAEAVEEHRERMYCESVAMLAPILADSKSQLALVEGCRLGDAALEGVRVRNEGHRDVRLFFDPGSHLLTKTEYEINETGKEVLQETVLQDYTAIDGVQRAQKMLTRWDGAERAERQMSDFRETDPAESEEFSKP